MFLPLARHRILNDELQPKDQQYYFMYPTLLSMSDFENFVEYEST